MLEFCTSPLKFSNCNSGSTNRIIFRKCKIKPNIYFIDGMKYHMIISKQKDIQKSIHIQ